MKILASKIRISQKKKIINNNRGNYLQVEIKSGNSKYINEVRLFLVKTYKN